MTGLGPDEDNAGYGPRRLPRTQDPPSLRRSKKADGNQARWRRAAKSDAPGGGARAATRKSRAVVAVVVVRSSRLSCRGSDPPDMSAGPQGVTRPGANAEDVAARSLSLVPGARVR